MSYKKHFAKHLNINPVAIVGFIPRDGNHLNLTISNTLVIIDPGAK